MAGESKHESAAAAMRQINSIWLAGQVEKLASMVHPDIVMAFPGFTGQTQGREEFIAGFRDFCQNARIIEFDDHDHQIDVAGNTAESPSDTIWSTSVPVSDTVRPVATYGYSRGKATNGSLSGALCST